MRVILFLVISFFALVGHTSSARADCAGPVGLEGAFIYNTDFHVMQFCNGTSWISMGSGAGGSVASGSSGFIQFSTGSALGNSGTTAGDEYFWDNTNKRLGVGTATPAQKVDVVGTVATNQMLFKPVTGASAPIAGGGGSSSSLKLAVSNNEPVTCNAGSAGTVALTTYYTMCVCRNGSGWVSTVDGASSCDWGTPDPSFSSVILLMHMDGANGGTSFTDNSSLNQTVTRTVINATPIMATTVKKYGSASMYSNNARASVPYSSNWIFGTGNLTVEAFVYPDNLASTYGRAIFTRSWSGNNYFIMGIDTSGRPFYILDSVTTTASAALSANTWYHMALVRNGNAWNLYVNGVSVANSTNSTNLNNTNATAIGIGGYGSSDELNWSGYIDELRVTKGVARYTSAFTPPAFAFTNQ